MSTDLQADKAELLGDINKYDFRNDERYVFKARKGLDPQIVSEISERKGEPAWMRDFRLKSLEVFNSKPVPAWGAISTSIFSKSTITSSRPTIRAAHGTTCPTRSRRHSTGWESPRRKRSILPE